MDGIPDRLLIRAEANKVMANIVATLCSLLYFKLDFTPDSLRTYLIG
jgi:hypothetical protein